MTRILHEAGPEGTVRITIAMPFRFESPDIGMDGVGLNLGDGARIERQQRLGTRTALIRRGDAAANRVPPPSLPRLETGKPAPGLNPEEEQALLESVQEFQASPLDSYCYGAMHLMTPVRAWVWPIDARRALPSRGSSLNCDLSRHGGR